MREQAYEIILADREIALTEPSAVRLPGGAVVGLQDSLGNVSPRTPAQPDRPMLATLLLELLGCAQQALAGNGKQADEFIGRATAILNAEVRLQSAARYSLNGSSGRSHLAPWQARRVIEFVEANFAGPIALEDLAHVARLSVSHFSKAFRLDFGLPPHGYIVRRRIEQAQKMMLLTDEPLALIALACGLADQSHLTRLFHRIVGVSPASWRRLRHTPMQ
jgi:AraC-like DNA-binding protein